MNKLRTIQSLIACFLLGIIFPASALDDGGFYSIGFDNIQNTGQNSSRLVQYLRLDLLRIGVPELEFHGFGRLRTGLHEYESGGDLYVAYLEYKSFQNETNIKLGRFDLITNRFMLLDGAQFTRITPWNFGVSAFIGSPRYKELEDNKDEFRYTGDLAFGGRIFLSGIESVQLNINYYRESGDDDNGINAVYKETAGAAASYYRALGSGETPFTFNTGLTVDHDLQNNVLARLSGHGNAQYNIVRLSVNADYFDVLDNYPADRELIIRLLSTGRESRFGSAVYVDVTDNINVYAGATFTKVEMRGNVENIGGIYRLGAKAVFVEELGFSAGIEGYRYDSAIGDATGLTISVDWYFAQDLALYAAYESAWLRNGSADSSAYSIEAEISAYLTENLIFAIYGRNGSQNNRFVDHYRWGGRLKYEF